MNAAVVDGGFLELVRMGVKRANDPTITGTLAAYDAVLATTINDSNQAWFRYNFDGYGEHNDGSDFDGTGVGRAWPIFTAERGMYSIASSGSGQQRHRVPRRHQDLRDAGRLHPRADLDTRPRRCPATGKS